MSGRDFALSEICNLKSAICNSSDEVDNLVFRPVAIVVRGLRADEAAVAAVRADAEGDVRVTRDSDRGSAPKVQAGRLVLG